MIAALLPLLVVLTGLMPASQARAAAVALGPLECVEDSETEDPFGWSVLGFH